ncbi:hypothetical protein [Planktothrix phage Pra-JY27]|nr:hypothetical protein [Planktothrix phage Pag-Yong1]WEV89257.1 hypothetical protein [Synechococcus phage MinM2]
MKALDAAIMEVLTDFRASSPSINRDVMASRIAEAVLRAGYRRHQTSLTWEDVPPSPAGGLIYRLPVEGGWLYLVSRQGAISTTFVPSGSA